MNVDGQLARLDAGLAVLNGLYANATDEQVRPWDQYILECIDDLASIVRDLGGRGDIMTIILEMRVELDDHDDMMALVMMMTRNYRRVSFNIDGSEHIEDGELSDDETAADILSIIAVEAVVGQDEAPPHGIERPQGYWVNSKIAPTQGSGKHVRDLEREPCSKCGAPTGKVCITEDHGPYRRGHGHAVRYRDQGLNPR